MFAVSNAQSTPVKAPLALNRPARVLKASRQVKMRYETAARAVVQCSAPPCSIVCTAPRLTTELGVQAYHNRRFCRVAPQLRLQHFRAPMAGPWWMYAHPLTSTRPSQPRAPRLWSATTAKLAMSSSCHTGALLSSYAAFTLSPLLECTPHLRMPPLRNAVASITSEALAHV